MSEQLATNTSAQCVALPWQHQQWARLIGMHGANRLPHALLLSGESGVGKRRFAQAWSTYLMCESVVERAACGHCRQCRLIQAQTHPDLRWIEPEDNAKQIKVDQIRELLDFVNQTSQLGAYKIAIVSPAESMNINASNALLKCLEEPTGNTLLVLLTDAPNQLLATIKSRCQTVTFPLPPEDQALAWLMPLVASDKQAQSLLSEAARRPLAALALLENDGIGRYQQMEKEFLSMLCGKTLALTVAQSWLEYDLPETLEWLSRRMIDVVRFRYAGAQLADQWQLVVQNIDIQAVFMLLGRINELRAKLLNGANANPQLTLEELLIKSCETFHGI